jgi:hypothetical protein
MMTVLALVGAILFAALGLIAYAAYLAEGGVSPRRASSMAPLHRANGNLYVPPWAVKRARFPLEGRIAEALAPRKPR